jgi:hypothetical protein
MADRLSKVAVFWHRIARQGFVSHADAATLEMFEGLTVGELNEALFRVDSDGEEISKRVVA